MRIRVPIKRIAGFCKHWVSIPKRRQRAAVNKRGPFYTEHTLTEGGGGPRRPEEGSALGKRLFLHSKDGRGAGGGGKELHLYPMLFAAAISPLAPACKG